MTGWPAANCTRRTLRALRRLFRARPRRSRCITATAGRRWARCCRPQESRGLVLIDPPYRGCRSEFDRARRPAWRAGHRPVPAPACSPPGIRSSTARRSARSTPRCSDSGIRDVVAAELLLREPLDPARLNGCGLLVVNPPYRFEQEAAPILAALAGSPGRPRAGRRRVDRRGWPMSSVAVHRRRRLGHRARDPGGARRQRRRRCGRAIRRAREAIAASRENPRLPGLRLPDAVSGHRRAAGSRPTSSCWRCRCSICATSLTRLPPARRRWWSAPRASRPARCACRWKSPAELHPDRAGRRADRAELRARDRRRPAGRRRDRGRDPALRDRIWQRCSPRRRSGSTATTTRSARRSAGRRRTSSPSPRAR